MVQRLRPERAGTLIWKWHLAVPFPDLKISGPDFGRSTRFAQGRSRTGSAHNLSVLYG